MRANRGAVRRAGGSAAALVAALCALSPGMVETQTESTIGYSDFGSFQSLQICPANAVITAVCTSGTVARGCRTPQGSPVAAAYTCTQYTDLLHQHGTFEGTTPSTGTGTRVSS